MELKELQINQLVKSFSGREDVMAVDHVDIEVKTGELLVLLGPSGCGKTTLLRCVAGLEDPQKGSITLEGKKVFDASSRLNVPTHKRDIGMMFQNYSLWPHMTVRKNVEYPLRARGFNKAHRSLRVSEVLEIVQCGHLADRFPAMLSGGQQQRVALARALAPKPAILLLDEPLSNLDALLRIDLRAQLRTIHRELGFTGIYVTHDQTEALSLGTAIAVMRAGKVEQLSSAAEVYNKPATDYVAKFLGIRNSFDLNQNDDSWSGLVKKIACLGHVPRDSNANLQIYFRPEHVQLALQQQGIVGERAVSFPPSRVIDTLYVGGEFEYILQGNGKFMYAKVPASARRFNPGDQVVPFIALDHVLIYAKGRLLNLQ